MPTSYQTLTPTVRRPIRTPSTSLDRRRLLWVHQQWACFRAGNQDNVYGYGKAQVDLTPPVITISQNGAHLIVTDTGIGLYSHFISDTDPDCSAANKDAVYITGQTTTALVHQQWACFRAGNQNNVYGYGKAQIDLTPPLLVLSQTGASITVTGTELSDFAYFLSDVSPVCSGDNQTVTYIDGATATDLVDNQWACFRARNLRGVWGYASASFNSSSAPIIVPLEPTTPGSETPPPTQPQTTSTLPIMGQAALTPQPEPILPDLGIGQNW